MADSLIFKLEIDTSDADKLDAFEEQIKKLEKEFKKLSSTFLGVSENLKGFGNILSSAFSMGLSAITSFASAAKSAFDGIVNSLKKVGEFTFEFVTDSVREFQKFEDILIVARRTMGLTEEETKQLGDTMRELGLELRGVTANELTNIAGIAGTLGLSLKDGEQNLKDFVTAIAQIGIATDISITQAAEKIPSILSIYRVATEDMGAETALFGTIIDRLGNSMNATQSQILKVSSAIAGTAATAGISKVDMLALSATIATVEKRFGTAGSAMAQILTKLTTDSTKWAETLGISSEKLLTALRDNPVKGLQLVLAEIEKLQQTEPVDVFNAKIKELGLTGVRTSEMMKKLSQVTGVWNEAIAVTNDELEHQNTLTEEAAVAATTLTNLWKDMMDALAEIHRIVGEPLLNAIKELLDQEILPRVNDFVEWFKTSELIQIAWTQMIQAIKEILQTDILPLVDQFVEWMKTSDGLANFFSKTIPAGIQVVKNAIIGIIADFRTFLSHIRDGKTIWEALVATFPKLRNLEENVKQVWRVLQDLWEMIKNVSQAIKDSGIEWEDVFTGAVILLDTTITTMNDLINLVRLLIELFKGAFNPVELFGKMVDKVFSNLSSKIGDVIGNLLGLKNSMNEVNEAQKEVAKEGYESSTWPDMRMWIQKNIETTKALGGSFTDTISKLNQIETATGKNVAKLRELAILQKNAESRGDLMRSGALSPEGLFRTSEVGREEAARRRQLQQDIFFPEPAQRQATETQRESTAAWRREGKSVVVNFNGTNIVDENSQEQFARRIGSFLKEDEQRLIIGA
jgi:TP901 family phage tail tape measure protein